MRSVRQIDCRNAIRSAISLARQPRSLPCRLPPPQAASKRSASVFAQPLCMNGPRLPMPTSDGTWNAPARADVDGRVVRERARRRGTTAQARARRIVEQRAAALDRGRIGRRGARHARLPVDPGHQPVDLVGRQHRARHAAHEHVGHQARHVGLFAVPVERLGAAQGARVQRLRPARALAGEVPDAAVVVALRVAGRAGQEAARVGVEDQVAGVRAADRRQRDRGAVGEAPAWRARATARRPCRAPSKATAIGWPTVCGTDGVGNAAATGGAEASRPFRSIVPRRRAAGAGRPPSTAKSGVPHEPRAARAVHAVGHAADVVVGDAGRCPTRTRAAGQARWSGRPQTCWWRCRPTRTRRACRRARSPCRPPAPCPPSPARCGRCRRTRPW